MGYDLDSDPVFVHVGDAVGVEVVEIGGYMGGKLVEGVEVGGFGGLGREMLF